MARASPDISAVAFPSRTSALEPETGASTKPRLASVARFAMPAISAGEQVVVQIIVVIGEKSALVKFVEHFSNLRGIVQGDDDRPARRDQFGSGGRGVSATGPQRFASRNIDVESDHGKPGVDQARG